MDPRKVARGKRGLNAYHRGSNQQALGSSVDADVITFLSDPIDLVSLKHDGAPAISQNDPE
jgi:hypothetical protein